MPVATRSRHSCRPWLPRQNARSHESVVLEDRWYRMTEYLRSQLFDVVDKEHTGVDDESGRAQFAHVPEDLIELTFVAGPQYMKLQSKFVCSRFHFLQRRLGEGRIGRVDE